MSDTVQVIVEQQTDNVLVRVAQVIGPQGPTGPTGSPGADGTVTVSETAPSSATAGQLWYNPSTESLYVYDGAWTEVSGGAVVVVSDTTPADPETGTVWYDSSDGTNSVWDGTVWVQVSHPESAAGSGPTGTVLTLNDGTWLTLNDGTILTL